MLMFTHHPNPTLQKQWSNHSSDEALSVSLSLPSTPPTFFSPYLNYSSHFCFCCSLAVLGIEPQGLAQARKALYHLAT